jgi:2-iminoacetate synthase
MTHTDFSNFIDPAALREVLAANLDPSPDRVREVVDHALALNALSVEQTAVLLGARDPRSVEIIVQGARALKRAVYGERIVLFAPLYVGNRCVNNCLYCGFRADNAQAVRRTLSESELRDEVLALERTGQKRLILVYGEHPDYSAEYIASTVRQVYATRGENGGRINRVNINAAPLDVEGFRTVREAGIGTYQIFQETYDPEVYARFHPSGRKADYMWRLGAMDRAMQAGIDDVGLGALFGLGEWRFEVLALVRHALHLEDRFGVGPHTVSFPRIRPASGLAQGSTHSVGDDDFARAVVVLRLALPYAGLILTAREAPELRKRLIDRGISQIDAGTNLHIGGYSASRHTGVSRHTDINEASSASRHTVRNETSESSALSDTMPTTDGQDLNREQFEQGDLSSLADAARELIRGGLIPSFCTACYRLGRTGEHFMAFSKKGFIKRFCTPNALLTLAEYLEDHASGELRAEGWAIIENKLAEMESDAAEKLRADLTRIRAGEREILY